MRAVIVSAAQDERLLKDTMATSLVPRILAYVRHHLTFEQGLSTGGLCSLCGPDMQ